AVELREFGVDALHGAVGGAGRHEQSPPDAKREGAETGLLQRRHVRNETRALRALDGEDLHLATSQLPGDVAHADLGDVDLAGEERGDHRRAALVWNAGDVDLPVL